MNVMSYKEALCFAEDLDMIIVPYESEKGMKGTAETLSRIRNGMSIGIFIGSEGGFDDKEITLAKEKGAEIISLGKRILRTETAAMTSVAMCMLHIEMNGENG